MEMEMWHSLHINMFLHLSPSLSDLSAPSPSRRKKITIATAITITPLQESEKCGPTVEGR